MEHFPWYYRVGFNHERDKLEVAFQPLPTADIMASIKAVPNEPDQMPSKEEASPEPCPTLGPCSNIQVADFDLKKEIEHLPFKINLGDVPLDKEQKANLIYSNQEVFSLYNEDLSYCN